MNGMENLPFYDEYMHLVESKRDAEKEIVELENPEKQLERIKKFYQNIGADYSKNQWLTEAEENISETNRGEDSRMSQLKRDVKLGTVVENAVEKQDDDSIRALNAYGNNEMYADLVRQIMFYIDVCKVKNDPDSIEEVCKKIIERYNPIKATLFAEEGVNYYIFYLKCMQICLKRYRNHSQYENVKSKVWDRCLNLNLMLIHYADDPYIDNEVKSVLTEISDTYVLMRELMREDTEEVIN